MDRRLIYIKSNLPDNGLHYHSDGLLHNAVNQRWMVILSFAAVLYMGRDTDIACHRLNTLSHTLRQGKLRDKAHI